MKILSALLIVFFFWWAYDLISFSAEDLWYEVASYREDLNLPTASESKYTCYVADKRINEVQVNYSHEGFYKYGENRNLGEILADGFTDESDTLNAWLNSPPHKAVIEDNYTHSCLRCLESKCVMIFEKP